ncbi:MAG: cell division protein FtsQ/DivIB [Clostridia bacterium]|nr:cell division protein FtsQ/DivIB [Clostridia bacterium]
MLILEGKYVYINNQGYILEISETKLEVPTITGYVTEKLEPGKRLEEVDLKKLNTVIQIVKTAEEKELDKKISDINIENERDFLITIESESKLIHFGDSSNVNDKFINIDAVLKDTIGQKGEIFVKDLNKVFFREDFREEGV